MSKAISTPDAPKPAGPYAQAIRVGATIYCAGQIPVDPRTGELVADEIASQTRQVLSNLRAVLAAERVGLPQVVRTTVFLADLDDYGVMNETYGAVFAGHAPARTTIEVSALPRGARIEIDAIAVVE